MRPLSRESEFRDTVYTGDEPVWRLPIGKPTWLLISYDILYHINEIKWHTEDLRDNLKPSIWRSSARWIIQYFLQYSSYPGPAVATASPSCRHEGIHINQLKKYTASSSGIIRNASDMVQESQIYPYRTNHVLEYDRLCITAGFRPVILQSIPLCIWIAILKKRIMTFENHYLAQRRQLRLVNLVWAVNAQVPKSRLSPWISVPELPALTSRQ